MASNTRILIADSEWRLNDEAEDHTGLLYGGDPFVINGVQMHLSAIPVVDRPVIDDGEAYGIQEGADGYTDEYLGLSKIDPDGAFQTWLINGRDYVLVMTPHQA